MKEPTTVEEAKQLTLDKIDKCRKLPRDKRGKFWVAPIWDNRTGLYRYCAFCLVVDCDNNEDPICLKACQYYSRGNKNYEWSNDFLRKLYRMVEAIEC